MKHSEKYKKEDILDEEGETPIVEDESSEPDEEWASIIDASPDK